LNQKTPKKVVEFYKPAIFPLSETSIKLVSFLNNVEKGIKGPILYQKPSMLFLDQQWPLQIQATDGALQLAFLTTDGRMDPMDPTSLTRLDVSLG
jgi:hypothetical protein